MVSHYVWLLWLLHLVAIATCQQLGQGIAQVPADPRAECTRPVAQCEPLRFSTCLDVALPFKFTSTELANDSETQEQIQGKLTLWSGLRSVPKCWEVIQPLLCAIYMPKCNPASSDNGTETENTIELPGKDICDITRQPCQIVDKTEGWPEFLKCDQDYFKEECTSTTVKKLVFNTTGTCSSPLVQTDNKDSWYQDVEGCGIQCQNPLFTDSEHDSVHIFIAICGSLCMLCTLITILTFIIDWKNASRYPALILFFINCCFFVGSVGWMAQFLPGARQDIVCRRDGTWRQSEPQLGSGESASCTIIFIIVYFSMMAAITWFVILAFAWHLIFRALGTPRDVIEGKRGHFHLVAWSVPLVLTIVCLALTQVEGDSLSGICFVGYMNHTYRGCFVLLPVGIVIAVGMGFLLSGLITLIKMKIGAPGYVSNRASAKIRDTIIRLGIFSSLAFLFVTVTFIVHVYIFMNESKWELSFKEYIICETNARVTRLMSNETTSCKMEDRPNMVATRIHIFAYFGAGIGMSSWVWNTSTAHVWRRFFRRLRHKPERKPVKLRKHQVIAQAFSKRGEMHLGRLSLSFHSTHDDPLGMKFDLNSVSSHEMSSAWAAAIPRMIMRRGGLVQRRHSDSDWESVQSTTRRMSFESHCLSMGSQSHLSQANVNPSPGSHASVPSEHDDNSTGKKKKRRKRRKRARNRIAPMATPTSSGFISTDPGSFASRSLASASSAKHADNESSDSANSVDRYRLPPGRQEVKATVEPQPIETEDPPVEELPLAEHPRRILVAEYKQEDADEKEDEDEEEEGGKSTPVESNSDGVVTPVPSLSDHVQLPEQQQQQQQNKRECSPVPAALPTHPLRWKNPFVHHRHRVHPHPFMPQQNLNQHVQPMFPNPWDNPFMVPPQLMFGVPQGYDYNFAPPHNVYSPYSQYSHGEYMQFSSPSDFSRHHHHQVAPPSEWQLPQATVPLQCAPSPKLESAIAAPPVEETMQAAAFHTQTTETYSMFHASNCLPDVETPMPKQSWVASSPNKTRAIESWLSGSEIASRGSNNDMRPRESWVTGSEVEYEDEGAGDRKGSGKRPKKRAKIKSRDAVVAINLSQNSDAE